MRSSLRDVRQQKVDVGTLFQVVDVYGQVAARNLKEVKKDVLNNREYMSGMKEIFTQVKSAWEQQEIAGNLLPANNKEVVVFMAANLGFYGNILERTFSELLNYIKQNDIDAIVILGREGKQMFAERLPNKRYEYVDWDDNKVLKDSLDILVSKTVGFERITIFHGQYKDTVNQEVVATKLEGSPVEVLDYIFEPDPASIVELFESEIVSLVLEQSLWEGQLSKFAARIVHLGEAMKNIEDRQEELRLLDRRLHQDVSNKRQRSRLTSFRIMGKI